MDDDYRNEESKKINIFPNGLLLLSGFYKQDIPVIQQTCSEHGLRLISQTSKNKWVALKFNAI